MDPWRATELAIKSYFSSLFLGSFFISFVGGAVIGTDPLTFIFAPLFALFAGGIVVALVATPIYAGLVCAGVASYYSAALLAALIAAVFMLADQEEVALLFAVYGFPISLFAHFLATRAVKDIAVSSITPLRG